MASRGLTLTVRTAWWLPLYIHSIKWFYVLTGREPDWDKVQRVVLKGMKLKVNNQIPPFRPTPSKAAE